MVTRAMARARVPVVTRAQGGEDTGSTGSKRMVPAPAVSRRAAVRAVSVLGATIASSTLIRCHPTHAQQHRAFIRGGAASWA